MIKRLRNAFIAGLVLLAPLGVTLFVVNFLRVNIGAPVSAPIRAFLFRHVESIPATLNTILEFVAIIIVVVLITLLGFLSNYFLARLFVRFAETIIHSVPFINTVYKTVQQIVETFSKQQKAVFQEVVLIEYPRKGVYVVGFLTSRAKGEIQEKTKTELINIFVPTTPNPTSGFLLMVPHHEIIFLNMSVADGMKLIVSGGAVTPPWHHEEAAILPPASPQADGTS